MNKREAILWVGDYEGKGNSCNFLTLIENKPFLEYIFETYKSFGFFHIVLVINDKNHPVAKYFGNKFKDIKLSYAVCELSLGIVGAIKAGIKFTESENILVASGAILCGANIGKFYKIHCRTFKTMSILGTIRNPLNNKIVIEPTITGRIKNITTKASSLNKILYLSDIYMINKEFILSPVFDTAISLEKDVLELYYKTEDYYVMISKEHYFDLYSLNNDTDLSIIKRFNIEDIISNIETNQSQLELVS